MNRVMGAVRLHTIRPLGGLAIPWLIVLASFGINLAIWAVGDLGDEPSAGTGGLAALYCALLIVFVQTVTQTFPFALTLGLSRRAFYTGTAAVAAAQTLVYSAMLCVLAAAERGTDGWGMGLDFWAPYGLDRQRVVQQFLIYASLMLASSFLGIAIGVAAKRWGATGLWTLAIGAIVVFGGAAVLITAVHGWTDLGDWLLDRSAVALALGLAGGVALLSAGLSYTGLRRAVP